MMGTEQKHATIAYQNDLFRRFHMPPDGAKICKAVGIFGRYSFTNGVNAKGLDFQVAVIDAVAAFNEFGADNDPYGERDFGEVMVWDTRIFWKLDYYNLDYSAGSDEPENPSITRRVLTFMLPSEY